MSSRHSMLTSIIKGSLGTSPAKGKALDQINQKRAGDLAQGLERSHMRRCQSDVYERDKRGKLHRVTSYGKVARGRSFVSNEMRLTPQQRATANYFGSCFEILKAGGIGAEFLREAVDGGGGGAGGVSESMFHKNQVVVSAEATLRSIAPATYVPNRNRCKAGDHKAIEAKVLFSEFCVSGMTINHIAETHGWWTIREGQQIVGNRQAQSIREKLLHSLEQVFTNWDDQSIMIPPEFFGVETA